MSICIYFSEFFYKLTFLDETVLSQRNIFADEAEQRWGLDLFLSHDNTEDLRRDTNQVQQLVESL